MAGTGCSVSLGGLRICCALLTVKALPRQVGGDPVGSSRDMTQQIALCLPELGTKRRYSFERMLPRTHIQQCVD